MTYDQIALDILLSDLPEYEKRAALHDASRRAKREQRGTLDCPECGDRGPHDDNGARKRSELSFCCRSCGTHFDAEEV